KAGRSPTRCIRSATARSRTCGRASTSSSIWRPPRRRRRERWPPKSRTRSSPTRSSKAIASKWTDMRSILLTVASLAIAIPAFAQERSAPAADPMAETVTQYFVMVQRQFVSLADAMPADKWSFAPKDGQFKGVRTFAEQVKHVACANYGFFNQVERKTPPESCETGGPSPAKTKPELMQYLRESFAYATQVMRQLTPANAMDRV